MLNYTNFSKSFADHLFKSINPNSTLPENEYYSPFDLSTPLATPETHTTHLSVIGPNEDHVAVTA